MPDEDPEQLADALEHDAERLKRRSEEVKQRVEAVRADWERKRQDENVPGAAPPGPDETASSEADDEPPA